MKLGVFLIIFAVVGLVIAVVSLARSDNSPAMLFNPHDTNETYRVTKGQTGLYGIYPLHHKSGDLADEEHPAYVSASPTSLDLFVGKDVHLTGDFVLTYYVLSYPRMTKKQYDTAVETFQIKKLWPAGMR